MENIKTYDIPMWYRNKRLAREKLNPKFVRIIKASALVMFIVIAGIYAKAMALENGIKSETLHNCVAYHNCTGFTPVK